jgi:hypothetical protein
MIRYQREWAFNRPSGRAGGEGRRESRQDALCFFQRQALQPVSQISGVQFKKLVKKNGCGVGHSIFSFGLQL